MPTYKITKTETQFNNIKITVQKKENCIMQKDFFFKPNGYAEKYLKELNNSQEMLSYLYEEHKGGTLFEVGYSLFTQKYALICKN